jgi:hypothetical protein
LVKLKADLCSPLDENEYKDRKNAHKGNVAATEQRLLITTGLAFFWAPLHKLFVPFM